MSTKQYVVTRCLLGNARFAKAVLPHLKDDYFQGPEYKFIYKTLSEHVRRYHTVPDSDTILMAAEDSDMPDQVGDSLLGILNSVKENPLVIDNTNEKWAYDTAEDWCKERATRVALEEGIKIHNGKGENKTEQILSLMSSAASISFDRNLGHDYLRDYKSRYDFYHTVLDRIPTGIDIIDQITQGGFPKKTINVFQAGTNVGKTLIKCSIAANVVKQGRNVLYVTLEDSDLKIGKRIDGNLLDIPLNDLDDLSEAEYTSKMKKLGAISGMGRLIVKEWPGSTITTLQMQALIEDLWLQEGFKPDLVCVDYLNLVLSSRIKAGAANGMYNVIKCVAEELRAFAQINNCVVLTSTQTNRSGFTKTQLGLEDISESFGIAMTADWLTSIVTDEELDKKGLWACFHNKSRYADKSKHPKFMLGVNRDKQQVTDPDAVYQSESIVSAIPDVDFGLPDEDDEKSMPWN